MSNLTTDRNESTSQLLIEPADGYLTMKVDGQLFGIPVLSVQDVLGPQVHTHVPKAPPEIAGVLNLRGRVITAIDMRRRLGLPPSETDEAPMSVVVDFEGESYSLNVDTVGEVLSLSSQTLEDNSAMLSPNWRIFSRGIFWLDGELLVSLDVPALFDFEP